MATPCDDFAFGDWFTAVAPISVALLLVSTLASSTRAPYARRATGLAVACGASLFMYLMSGCSFLEFGDGGHITQLGADQTCAGSGLFAYGVQGTVAKQMDIEHADTGWYLALYQLAPLFDLGAVALGIFSFAYDAEYMIWALASLAVGFVHALGLFAGGFATDAVIVIAALVASGILRPVGTAFEDALSFLPTWMRVSEPLTHSVIALALMVAEPLMQGTADKLNFADAIVETQVVFGIISTVALLILAMENTPATRQVASLAATGALILTMYKANQRTHDIVTNVVPPATLDTLTPCTGSMPEVAEDLLNEEKFSSAFGSVLAPFFLAAATVLTYVDEHPAFGTNFAGGAKVKNVATKQDDGAVEKHSEAVMVECDGAGTGGPTSITVTGIADVGRGQVGALP